MAAVHYDKGFRAERGTPPTSKIKYRQNLDTWRLPQQLQCSPERSEEGLGIVIHLAIFQDGWGPKRWLLPTMPGSVPGKKIDQVGEASSDRDTAVSDQTVQAQPRNRQNGAPGARSIEA